MDLIVFRGLPILLFLGALVLAWRELSQRVLSGLFATPQGTRLVRVRKSRRVAGSVILGLVAFQIWTGQVPHAPVPAEQALQMLQHWASVFALVFLLVLFALWDTWEGVRYLRLYLEVVEKDELGRIREQLKSTPEGLTVLNTMEPSE